ncbi:MAG: glycosyltransferase family 2 protein [Proteobacteria bacterium]|nr:glycosyltransferase family 2 protein [Pseudomonadota bacterium]
MTYIIDLQRLWEGNEEGTASSAFARAQNGAHQNVVSVIVVAEPNEAMVMQTLSSVLAQKFVREVIIVNCEALPSLEKALTKFTHRHPTCYLVKGHKRAGLAAAYNLGAQHASGQFLLFIKGNCLLAKNAVASLLSTGIPKPAPWVIGAAEKKKRINFKPLAHLNLFSNAFETQTLPEVSLPGGGFHAAQIAPDCLFMSTQTFLELKGLDKKCFHSTFHMDLCLRVHFAGGGVYRARDFDVVACTGAGHSLRESIRSEWQAFCGRYHFYQKYVSSRKNKIIVLIGYTALLVGFLGRMCMRLLSNFNNKNKVG